VVLNDHTVMRSKDAARSQYRMTSLMSMQTSAVRPPVRIAPYRPQPISWIKA